MAKASDATKSYKQLSAELADILSRLEAGDLDIEDAVKSYEQGLAIVARLEASLKQAENTVTELKAAQEADDEEEE